MPQDFDPLRYLPIAFHPGPRPEYTVPMIIASPSRHRFLCAVGLMLLFSMLCVCACAEPADLSGQWVLDKKASDDAEDAFDGKLRRLPFETMSPSAPQHRRETTVERAQADYWEQIRQSEERRSMKNLRRIGTIYPLLLATRVDISAQDEGYLFAYDETLPRLVKPNPAGRIFSARGDELVVDSFGHTLSYWEGATLVIETDPPDGGKYLERVRVSASPRRLEYRFDVNVRELEESVEVLRVFIPAAGADR